MTTDVRCGACHELHRPIWARIYNDKGQDSLVCRHCWEDSYPCAIAPNFVKIPYRMKCVFGWSLTSPSHSLTIAPGEYEIGVIDALTDTITLWVYQDEVRPTDRNIEPHLTNFKVNDIRQELLKSVCSCEDGLQPVMALYSFVKSYGILYHKDDHIMKKSLC